MRNKLAVSIFILFAAGAWTGGEGQVTQGFVDAGIAYYHGSDGGGFSYGLTAGWRLSHALAVGVGVVDAPQIDAGEFTGSVRNFL